MENFETRKDKYMKKLYDHDGYGPDSYHIIWNSSPAKNKIKDQFLYPQNDQDLRLADGILSVVIDAVKMCSYEEIVAEDDGWNENLLVEYLSEFLDGGNSVLNSPDIAAQLLYEGARAIALAKEKEVTTKLGLIRPSEFIPAFCFGFLDMAIKYHGVEGFLDYLEEVSKKFHELFEEGYSEKRQIAETFHDRRDKYHEKACSERGLDAERYLMEFLFKNDVKMLEMICKPKNNQELRRVEAIFSIAMDYRSMGAYDNLTTDNDDFDREFLANYSKVIIDNYLGLRDDLDDFPEEMARFLFEGAKVLIIEPSALAEIVSLSVINPAIFKFINKVIYQTLFAKSDIKYLEEVAEAYHKLFQQEYGEKGYQYNKGKK